GPGEPCPPPPVRRPAGDLPRAELDPSRRGQVEAGQEVDEGRLPGAVRPDQPDHLVGGELEVDGLEGLDPLERARDADRPERRARPCAARQGLTPELSRQAGQWMLATTFVVCSPITLATLLLTSMIRYGRPVTLWNVGVNVIGPPSVLNLNRCESVAASLAP